jgi:hypothetical protein
MKVQRAVERQREEGGFFRRYTLKGVPYIALKL